MANDSATPDWGAMNRQFWNAWSDAARQAGGAAPAHAMPWQDGFGFWTQLAQAQGGGSNEVVERMLAGAKQFATFAQAAAQQASVGGAPAGDHPWARAFASLGAFDAAHNPVLDAIRSVSGDSARGFEQLQAEMQRQAEPMRRELDAALSLPAFGFARESQERGQALARALVEQQEAFGRYNALLLEASKRATAKLEGKLGERSEPGREIQSLRALYDLWIDAAEEGYAEIALSPEFRSAYGALVNAQMRVRKLMADEVERSTRSLGMPGRTEVDALHRSHAELRRRLARLEERLGDGAQDAAPPDPPATGTRERKTPPAAPRAKKQAAAPRRPASARGKFADRLEAARSARRPPKGSR